MKNSIIFLGVFVSAILTWFAYALLASLITYMPLMDCLTDDTVITFLFATGWILPSLVGFDLYMHFYRHDIKRNKRSEKEICEIKANLFSTGRRRDHGSLLDGRLHLN
ncbi:MAG: hypothetical protein ABI203_02410 [Mucilaginibacter sp.]